MALRATIADCDMGIPQPVAGEQMRAVAAPTAALKDSAGAIATELALARISTVEKIDAGAQPQADLRVLEGGPSAGPASPIISAIAKAADKHEDNTTTTTTATLNLQSSAENILRQQVTAAAPIQPFTFGQPQQHQQPQRKSDFTS